MPYRVGFEVRDVGVFFGITQLANLVMALDVLLNLHMGRNERRRRNAGGPAWAARVL